MAARGALVLLLALVLIVTRLPFLGSVLIGEEGSHAYLASSYVRSANSSPDGWSKQIVGYVAGKPILISAERNVVPYWLLENIARIVAPSITSPSFDARSRATRVPYLVLYALGVAGLIGLCLHALARRETVVGWAAISVAVFAMTAPLAVGGSIQPQLDGALGVALLGLAATTLIVADRSRVRLLLYTIAGALCGLGKHEWAMAFGGAAVVVFVLAFVVRRERAAPILCFAVGLAASVAFCFWLSPRDYLDGFDVMSRIYSATGGRGTAWDQKVLLAPAALVGLLGLALVRTRWRDFQLSSALLLIAGFAICAGYAVSGWRGDGFPRYYAPALVLFAYVCVSELTEQTDWLDANVIAGLAAIGIAWNVVALSLIAWKGTSISSGYGASLKSIEGEYAAVAQRWASDRSVILTGSGIWLYYPDVEFVSADMGPQGARRLIQQVAPADVGRFAPQ